MYRITPKRITEGRIDSERFAIIVTADGVEEEVIISPEQLDGDSLLLPVVAINESRVLVELPQESSSGRWRLWIHHDKAAS